MNPLSIEDKAELMNAQALWIGLQRVKNRGLGVSIHGSQYGWNASISSAFGQSPKISIRTDAFINPAAALAEAIKIAGINND